MGNITVEVIGNSAGGGGGGSQQQQPASGGVYSPDQSRMIEDVRREMQSRGVVMVPGSQTVQQLINQYGQNVQQQQDKEISARYNERRNAVHDVYSKKHDEVDDLIEEERKSRFGNLSKASANDPLWISRINEDAKKRSGLLHDAVDKEYFSDLQQIDEEEKAEREEANKELTNAIKELTEHFKREAKTGDSGSYVNRLREQQRELIYSRDNAATEEEAMGYNKQLVEINEKLRRVMSNGVPQQDTRGAGDVILNASRGIEQTLMSVRSGDLGGMIMGTGTTALGLSGLSGGALMKAMGWLGLAVGGVKMLTGTAESYNAFGTLSAMSDVSQSVMNATSSGFDVGGRDIFDYGLSKQDFAKEVEQRLRQRGGHSDLTNGDTMFQEVLRQLSVERSWGLNAGAVGSAGRFDVYGTNASTAINELMNQLVTFGNVGMRQGDFARAQEKLDFQQALMNSYLGRTDKPSYDVANRAVLAMNAVTGITHDMRDQSDYAVFQNAIQNPQNDAVRAMIYGTIGDLMPETGGRIDLIQRALKDPQNEGKIMQAVIQRLTQQFGGTDTQMGYMVMHQLFPNIADTRLDEYIQQFGGSSDAASILSGRKTVESGRTEQQNMQYALNKGARVSVDVFTSGMKEISGKLDTIIGYLTGAASNN